MRIGDPNRTIIGNHTYNISYTVHNAIAGFEEGSVQRTELYRNIIGTERATTIGQVNFTLHLPKETVFSSDDYYLIYGKTGEQKKERSQIALRNNSRIVGSVDVRLQANEGATIGVKFPSDYFNLSEEYLAIKAPKKERKWILDGEFFRILFGGALPFLIVVGMGIAAVWVGRMAKYLETFNERRIAYSKIGRPITIYYTPPRGVELPTAARIYGTEAARTFVAIIYD